MMSDHGVPCNAEEASYCMNGGTCFRLTSMSALSCVCNENYKGSRCEHYHLFTISSGGNTVGLIVALVLVAVLILVVLAFVIYFIHKMLKEKKQSQQSSQTQYWKVKPRV
ncbi:pro-neuregulin-4, membrane-bound isoform [Synchiropus picturatus]